MPNSVDDTIDFHNAGQPLMMGASITSAPGTFRTSGDVRFESAKRRIADMGQAALANLDL
jgi:hypothetical protein